MKKRVLIEVEIYPQGNADASNTVLLMPETDKGDALYSAYQIRVNPDPFATVGSGDPGGLMTSLAHELGHVLGGIFKTEAHQADPRTTNGRSGDVAGIIASEREAWDLGALVYPALDKAEAAHNLATYDNPASQAALKLNLTLIRLWEGLPLS